MLTEHIPLPDRAHGVVFTYRVHPRWLVSQYKLSSWIVLADTDTEDEALAIRDELTLRMNIASILGAYR